MVKTYDRDGKESGIISNGSVSFVTDYDIKKSIVSVIAVIKYSENNWLLARDCERFSIQDDSFLTFKKDSVTVNSGNIHLAGSVPNSVILDMEVIP